MPAAQTRYVALLAAVNVGGRSVKMAQLRAAVERHGFARVATYIQTGNLFFDVPSQRPPLAVRTELEALLRTEFGFAIQVALFRVDELAAILAQAPFPERELAASERALIVYFREAAPPLPPAPAISAKGCFELIGRTDRAVYVFVTDAPSWARHAPREMKRLLGPGLGTGRWRHTSEKILLAALT